MKKILSVCVVFFLAFTCFSSVSVKAEDSSGASLLDKSKKAEWTDYDKGIAKVNLSVPSESKKNEVDVVLVIDKSMGSANSGFPEKAATMLDELAKRTDMDCRVGVVSFDSTAYDMYNLATKKQVGYTGLVTLDDTNKAGLKAACNYNLKDSTTNPETPYLGGSNLSSALKMANKMLGEGTANSSNKMMVVLSDLATYSYDDDVTVNGKTYKDVPSSLNIQGYGTYLEVNSYFSTWKADNKYYKSFQELKEAYDSGTMQANPSWNNNIPYRYDNPTKYNSLYAPDLNAADVTASVQAGGSNCCPVSNGYVDGFSKAIAYSYEEFKKAYDNDYSINIIGNVRDIANLYNVYAGPILNTFLDYLIDDLDANYYNSKLDSSASQTIVDKIEVQIVNVMDKSLITDYIGKKFDLYNLNNEISSSPFELTVGDVAVPGVWDASTKTMTFANGDYVLKYDPDDPNGEMYTLQINVPIAKSAAVKLSYYLLLDQSLIETYDVEDLPTNVSADIIYWSSLDDSSDPDAATTSQFEVPILQWQKKKKDEPTPTPVPPTENKINNPTSSTVVNTGDSNSNRINGYFVSLLLAGGVIILNQIRRIKKI
ncbi:MAG: VWA domain-containing protein [Thomasclavelia sp.]|nr:VWA domain-containing protein [Thomasclavelia sp.]